MTSEAVYAVVLAGGSGTRFWPASRRLLPKQLLPIGPSAPDTLIRSVVDRMGKIVSREHVLVATGRHLLAATFAQLPELAGGAFLAEPVARNTAPCIGWAAWKIARTDPDAVLCVIPSDQHVGDEEAFAKAVGVAVSEARAGRIATIGVVPTRPETGYGYVKKGVVRAEGAFEVEAFVEKPDEPTAERYFESGEYLWNAGMFIFRASDMVAAFRQHLPAMAGLLDQVDAAWKEGPSAEFSAVESFFDAVDGISIDYGVMEKQDNLSVVPGDFGWSDLGSWETAWQLSSLDDDDNVAPEGTIMVDARRNYVEDLRVKKEAKRVIALVGVEDLVVVETDDALLVMPRGRSQDVRAVVDQLKARGDGDLV